MKVFHKNIQNKRHKAAVIYLDSKKSESKSSISLRNMEKEFYIPKTSIVRAIKVIQDGRLVGKRGRLEILNDDLVC